MTRPNFLERSIVYTGAAENARPEIARLDNAAPNCRTGKRRTGKRENGLVMERWSSLNSRQTWIPDVNWRGLTAAKSGSKTRKKANQKGKSKTTELLFANNGATCVFLFALRLCYFFEWHCSTHSSVSEIRLILKYTVWLSIHAFSRVYQFCSLVPRFPTMHFWPSRVFQSRVFSPPPNHRCRLQRFHVFTFRHVVTF